MDERGQFTFYRSYFDALKTLPTKLRLAVYEAICGYALDGIDPDLSGAAATAFILIKPTIDSGRRKAANGKKGGSKTEAKAKQNGSKTEANQKQTASEKEIEKENEIEIENEDEKENDCSKMHDPVIAAVMTAFMDKINPTPSPICIEELKAFAEQMGSECCIRAMDIALDAKKANWNYIRAILRSKLQQGVKCAADWDRLEESREGSQYSTFARPRATTSADIARMIEAGEFDD